MFTLPPLPPKDYFLTNVVQNQLSNPEHTPDAPPRVTQLTLGKFCSPIEYKEQGEELAHIPIESVNSRVLDQWTNRCRAWWVDKPGKNDYFLHDISNKYSVVVEDSYDARYRHKERTFYRPFRYEFDCIEQNRFQKLLQKMEREANEELRSAEERNTNEKEIYSCKEPPPIWWQARSAPDKATTNRTSTARLVKAEPVLSTTYQESYPRWIEEPDVLAAHRADVCQRRKDMTLIGLPYRNEASNWYYKNYPAPNLRRIHKRFV